jgi:hypothetical protein
MAAAGAGTSGGGVDADGGGALAAETEGVLATGGGGVLAAGAGRLLDGGRGGALCEGRGAGFAGVIWRRGPHVLAGSVPRTKAMGTTRTHSLDGSMSTGTIATRSGMGKSSLGLLPSTRVM